MLLDSWRGFWVLQVLENRSHKYYSLGATSIREYVEFMEDSDLAINFNPWEYVDSAKHYDPQLNFINFRAKVTVL